MNKNYININRPSESIVKRIAEKFVMEYQTAVIKCLLVHMFTTNSA